MASVFAVWPVDLSSTIKVNRGARMGLRRTAALANSFRPVVYENAFTMKTSHLDGTEDIQKSWKEKIWVIGDHCALSVWEGQLP